MAGETSRGKKGLKQLKWTEQMNIDCLDCKRKAQDLIASENPPVSENGRRKGYIKVMKELWGAMGHENLGLTSQNLRDQAARLEKMRSDTSEQSRNNETEDITNLNSRERNAEALRGRDIAIFQTTAAIETTAEHADLLSCGNLHETVSDFNDEYNKELQCP